MKRVIVVMTTIATIIAFLTGGFTSKAATEEDVLLAYVNQARTENGLKPLKLDKELTRAANIRAAECADVFSHTRPDGTEYFTVSKMVNGENLSKAKSYNTLEEVFEAWMLSPSHKGNILFETSTKTGFGIYKSGDIYYVTEEFN